MSRNSYTASERRGILAIALLALLLIGGGVTLSLCGRQKEIEREIPVVIERPDLVDSLSLNSSSNKKLSNKQKTVKKSKKQNTDTKKTYRRRSPLDEPV